MEESFKNDMTFVWDRILHKFRLWSDTKSYSNIYSSWSYHCFSKFRTIDLKCSAIIKCWEINLTVSHPNSFTENGCFLHFKEKSIFDFSMKCRCFTLIHTVLQKICVFRSVDWYLQNGSGWNSEKEEWR